jgi:hypothetical protein
MGVLLNPADAGPPSSVRMNRSCRCHPLRSAERVLRLTVCGGSRQEGNRLGGVVGIENHPEPAVIVGWSPRGFGRDHRLDIGGLEDVLEP